MVGERDGRDYAHLAVLLESAADPAGSGAPFGEVILTWPAAGLPAVLRALPRSTRADALRAFLALDLYSPGPIVAVDGTWRPGALRAAVLAGLCAWALRTGWWTLDAPAYDWFAEWARRAGRSPDELDPAEVYEIAQRGVRPGSPAGHRAYWRQTVRPTRGPDRMRAALDLCTNRGQPLGRSAAYERLRRGGVHVRDFATPTALAAWLSQNAPSPPKPALPDARRDVRDQLLDLGWTPAGARKFEYRLRPLPQDEQARRVRAALARRTGTVSTPPTSVESVDNRAQGDGRSSAD